MNRSCSLSLCVSATLSLAAASAASAAGLAAQYKLLTPTANDIANSSYNGGSQAAFTVGAFVNPGTAPNNLRFNDFDIYPTNLLGQSVIAEQGSVTTSAGSSIGKLLVLFDSANPQNGLVPIGPAGIYNFTSSGGTQFVSQNITGYSATGYVSGNSLNANSKGIPWLYVPGTGPVTLGLTGALATSLYEPNSSTFNQSVNGTAGNGWTVGLATRYSSSGSVTLGSDVWYYNPTNASTVAIVPLINSASAPATNYQATVTGSGTYENTGNPVAISASGLVIGASTRYLNGTVASGTPTSYGTDAWLYNAGASSLASAATQIGLLLDPSNNSLTYTLQTSTNIRTNAVYTISTKGVIGGATTVYTRSSSASAGTMTWLYTPGTAPGTLNVSYASPTTNSFANSSTPGTIGNSTVGIYTRVGLYGDSAHVNAQGLDASVIQAINPSGQATGYSTIYLSNHTAASGTGDAWAYSNSTGTTLINPVTTSTSFSLQYNNNTGGSNVVVRNATITGINSNGWVAGYSQRYDFNYTGTSPTATQGTNTSSIISSPLGYDAWLYDAANQQTYVVDDSVSSVNGNAGYFYSAIQYLSDTGIALGYYTNIPSQNPENIFAYYVDGSGLGHFESLGSGLTLSNTLAAGGWSSLSSLISIDANGNLYGLGTTTSGNANAVFELQAIPEPASLSIFSLAAVGLLARRRKA